MAKLTDRTELTSPADGDLYVTTDVSDTSDAATGTDKKITWANIKATLKTYNDTLYAAVLGSDDNYVTDAEKTVIGNTSGTNTGDQDLSSYVPYTGGDADIEFDGSAERSIAGGTAGAGFDGANMVLVGGYGGTGNTDGGDAKLIGGLESGTGVGGDVIFQVGGGGVVKITDTDAAASVTFDMSSISADRAYTLPNDDGTLALLSDVTAKPTISSGAGAPGSTPTKVGDIYIDTTGDDAYIAVGTASSADWEKTNDGAGGGVSDGDKGDITVSASGATWTIDNGAVTLAKQADMATASVVYRKTAGTGAPEVQTLATLKTDLGLTGTNSGDQTSIVGITGTKAQFDTAVTDGNFMYIGDAPTSHTHTASEITDFDTEVANNSAVTANTAKVTNATHTGDVTGATTLTIADDAVTYAKMQNVVANNVILGNNAGAGGVVDELTATEVRTIINVEDGADVTDAINVTAAGALMDSELTDITAVKALADAAASDVNTGTSTTMFVTPDALAGSNLGIRYVAVTLNGTTALTTSEKGYFRIPAALTGMNLVSVVATVGTGASGSSSSGTPTFTVKNVTDSNQMLSTSLTVDANEYTSATAATAAVINGSFDDVVTDDLIEVAVTTAGTGVTYATVTMGFQLP